MIISRIHLAWFFYSMVIICGSVNAQRVIDPYFDRELQELLEHDVPEIDVASLDPAGLFILDARGSEEYDVSHLPGARRIGFEDRDLSVLEGVARDSAIVVYCSVGYRSEKVVQDLRDMGYTKVQNLYGGIFEWANQGFALAGPGGTTDTVHTYNADWGRWLMKGVKVW